MDTLNRTRRDLATRGSTEAGILSDLPAAEDIWSEIQQVRNEMNKAKRAAAEKAAEPYKEKLAELETQYTLVLKLGG